MRTAKMTTDGANKTERHPLDTKNLLNSSETLQLAVLMQTVTHILTVSSQTYNKDHQRDSLCCAAPVAFVLKPFLLPVNSSDPSQPVVRVRF